MYLVTLVVRKIGLSEVRACVVTDDLFASQAMAECLESEGCWRPEQIGRMLDRIIIKPLTRCSVARNQAWFLNHPVTAWR